MTDLHAALRDLADHYRDAATRAATAHATDPDQHPAPSPAFAAATLAAYATHAATTAVTGYDLARRVHTRAVRDAYAASHGLPGTATLADVIAAAVRRALAPFTMPRPGGRHPENADRDAAHYAATRTALNAVLATLDQHDQRQDDQP